MTKRQNKSSPGSLNLWVRLGNGGPGFSVWGQQELSRFCSILGGVDINTRIQLCSNSCEKSRVWLLERQKILKQKRLQGVRDTGEEWGQLWVIGRRQAGRGVSARKSAPYQGAGEGEISGTELIRNQKRGSGNERFQTADHMTWNN